RAQQRATILAAVGGRGEVEMLLGDLPAAMASFEELKGGAEAAGERARELQAWRGIAAVHKRQGHFDEAEREFLKSLELARAAGDRLAEANTLAELGNVHLNLDQDRKSTR